MPETTGCPLDLARWALGVDAPVDVPGMGRKLFFQDDQKTPSERHPSTVLSSYAHGYEDLLSFWKPR